MSGAVRSLAVALFVKSSDVMFAARKRRTSEHLGKKFYELAESIYEILSKVDDPMLVGRIILEMVGASNNLVNQLQTTKRSREYIGGQLIGIARGFADELKNRNAHNLSEDVVRLAIAIYVERAMPLFLKEATADDWENNRGVVKFYHDQAKETLSMAIEIEAAMVPAGSVKDAAQSPSESGQIIGRTPIDNLAIAEKNKDALTKAGLTTIEAVLALKAEGLAAKVKGLSQGVCARIITACEAELAKARESKNDGDDEPPKVEADTPKLTDESKESNEPSGDNVPSGPEASGSDGQPSSEGQNEPPAGS